MADNSSFRCVPVRLVENMARPVIGQKSTRRKQWTLLNRTQNRYNPLAIFPPEDGWPDSLVDWAKQLLNCEENCEDEKDQEENASLGVNWLIKALSQRHKEATALLRQCLDTGKDIT